MLILKTSFEIQTIYQCEGAFGMCVLAIFPLSCSSTNTTSMKKESQGRHKVNITVFVDKVENSVKRQTKDKTTSGIKMEDIFGQGGLALESRSQMSSRAVTLFLAGSHREQGFTYSARWQRQQYLSRTLIQLTAFISRPWEARCEW